MENSFDKSSFIIEKVYSRKNFLKKPPIANLDQLFIVLSSKPKPDFILVDKLIIYCLLNEIKPYIVVNKIDLCDKTFLDDVKKQYQNVVNNIILISAKNLTNIAVLKGFLKDSFSAFAGQSAVGKSAILNAICPSLSLKTGELSKIDSGKHTTKQSSIYIIDKGMLVADTTGFSMLDLNIENVKPSELHFYYTEFNKYALKCKYNNCMHINTKPNECAVISALNNHEISLERYKRYLHIYAEFKKFWEKRYD